MSAVSSVKAVLSQYLSKVAVVLDSRLLNNLLVPAFCMKLEWDVKEGRESSKF